jgi:putative transposase
LTLAQSHIYNASRIRLAVSIDGRPYGIRIGWAEKPAMVGGGEILAAGGGVAPRRLGPPNGNPAHDAAITEQTLTLGAARDATR